jgi:hypothetical protein
MGHFTGMVDLDAWSPQLIRRTASDEEYPLTLDLRRRVPRGWGSRASEWCFVTVLGRYWKR